MMKPDVTKIIDTVKSVVQMQDTTVSLHEPFFDDEEISNLKDCIDSSYVSSVGPYVDEFERKLQDFTGAGRAVAVVNGTAALHICLVLAGTEPQDEVLLPTLTFVATANAISYCGAVPHFVDSDEETLGVHPGKLREYLKEVAEVKPDGCFNRMTGRRIRALVPMHTFGHAVDIDALVQLCEEFHLTLIEDAAESLGTYYKGHHTGTFGRVAALSFNGNKIVTTGGGGAILTNDETLGNLAKHLTTTAKIPHPWKYQHDRIGYNYRMPNINAALGCAQMKKLPDFLKRKRNLASRYSHAFSSVPEVDFFHEPDFSVSNYWLNAIILKPEYANLKDEILECTHTEGLMTRPVWTPMHELPMYRNCPKMDLSIAEDLERRLINLPSSAVLGGMDE